jgi:tRNA(fMet)-specific endonuclease VapC
MMAFDADVLTEILAGNPAYVARAETIPTADQAVPIVVVEEFVRGRWQVIRQAEAGTARISLPRAYDLLAQTIRDMTQLIVLAYTPQADVLYHQRRQQRLRMGTHDLRIAAICVAHAATLLSRNRRDSVRVPGLQVEFWDAGV